MAEMDPGVALGGNPFKITDPEYVPASRYHAEEFFKLECEKMCSTSGRWPAGSN